MREVLRDCLDALALALRSSGVVGVAAIGRDGTILAMSSGIAAGTADGTDTAGTPAAGGWQLLRSASASGNCRLYALHERVRPSVQLTRRQVQVLRLLDENLTAPAIARRLGVSVRTVYHHVELIYGRLGVHDRLSALRTAHRLRLLSGANGVTRTADPFLPGPARGSSAH